jgi:PAS domain S-box-containing protein
MAVAAFLKVIDRLPDAYALLTGEGVVLGANRRIARLGIDPKALLGKPLSEVTSETPSAVASYLHRCAKVSEPLLGSLTLRHADGTLVRCRATGNVLIPASEKSEAVVMLRLESCDAPNNQFVTLNHKIEELGKEILKRQHVELELRQQKELLAVTLKSIGDALIATDISGQVIFMNEVAESLTGWTQTEATGKPLEMIFKIVNEATREPVESPVERCLREGGIVGLADHTILVARDGTEHSIDDTAAPIRAPGGRSRGVVLVFHDVGDRRRLERELYDRAEMLAENDRRKDEFLAMLAHELRNPISSISNAVLVFGKEETEEDLLWAKGVVQRQVKHLARLIDDLLDVSRISRGKISLRKEALNLSPIVSAAVEAARPLMEERKHELSVSLVNEGLQLAADPVRLEQILVNLLTNAAKYTENGGKISLSARHIGSDIVIKVHDNGMGIPPDLLPRIFDLFAQGDRSIARSEGGLGIGLTLVQKLAEMHGGAITAASEGAGKGSVFTVRLPALQRTANTILKPKTTLPRFARQCSRVLVVDDNVDNVRGLARLLRLLGHDVQVAYDGMAAIEVARNHKPEIVLLDIGLPGMDGYQIVARLRMEECCKEALFIAISGYGQPEDLRRSEEAGFDHHLVKPLDYDALMTLFAPITD